MNHALIHFSIACFLGTISACASSVSPYALATAGRIGCPAEHIELSRVYNDDNAPQAWIASCGREHYACSSNGDPRRANTRVVCSEVGGRRSHALSWRR